jgi:hypothetical protein
MAEELVESHQKKLGNTLPPGQGMTLRYSPGYCDWPIEQQESLFQVVDGGQIGVSLSRHFLMRPSKSISGIVGIGPAHLVEETKNACRTCGRKECNHRRSA